MDNKNIVIMLREGIGQATGQKIYPVDIAHLLGYGGTQIKQYFKWAYAGEIKKPNERLERVARFAYRLGELEGFESLFPLIPKLAGELDNADWSRRTGQRMDKMIRSNRSIEGQLDLVEEIKRTENDDQITQFFGITSPLTLNMIESDTQNGHISVSYDALINQLQVFDDKGSYEFEEVRAALVALECPAMVKAADSEPKKLRGDVEDYCDLYLSDALPENDERKLLALKITTAAEQLNISSVSGIQLALAKFVYGLNEHENLRKLCNIRLARCALRDSDHIKPLLSSKAETDDQTTAVLWPKFVTKNTREALKNFDAAKINWALAQKGEKVINRVLAGYVKEAVNG